MFVLLTSSYFGRTSRVQVEVPTRTSRGCWATKRRPRKSEIALRPDDRVALGTISTSMQLSVVVLVTRVVRPGKSGSYLW